MKIVFKSTIKQNNEENVIEFESDLTKSKYDKNFDVYEFLEPKEGIMNRIEVSDTKVNIFAGVASINLELGKDIAIGYQTNQGVVYLNSNMKRLESNEEKVSFMYTLDNNGEVIGNYDIELIIKK